MTIRSSRTTTTTTDATAPSVGSRIRAALADANYAHRRMFEIRAGAQR